MQLVFVVALPVIVSLSFVVQVLVNGLCADCSLGTHFPTVVASVIAILVIVGSVVSISIIVLSAIVKWIFIVSVVRFDPLSDCL